MTVNAALSGLHLRWPSLATLRRLVAHIARTAATSGWVTAGATVVGLGYGRPLAVAVLAVGAYLFGAWRAGRRWQARFALFAVGVQANTRAFGQLLASHERVWVERSEREAAERNSLPFEQINAPYTSNRTSNERSSR